MIFILYDNITKCTHCVLKIIYLKQNTSCLNMSATKAALKKVDERTKCLLFGYNRKHPQTIPIPITNLCLFYYFEHDKWNELLMHSEIELKSDNATIEKIGKHRASCNAYLSKEFESGKHEWKFKIINLKYYTKFH